MKKIDYINAKSHFVSFIDILGYRDMICNEELSDDLLNSIVSILGNYSDLKDHEEFEFNMVSDAIVIATECFLDPQTDEQQIHNYFSFTTCLMLSAEIQLLYLSKGYLCKGGLSLGKYVSNEQFVFGSALAKAVDIEMNNHSPCVVIDDEALEIYLTSCEYELNISGFDIDNILEPLNKLIMDDGIGNACIDYLNMRFKQSDSDGSPNIGFYCDDDIIECYEGFVKSIKNCLSNHKDTVICSNIVEKYEWTSKYFHRSEYDKIFDLDGVDDLIKKMREKTVNGPCGHKKIIEKSISLQYKYGKNRK